MANALAYYDRATIMGVIQAHGVNVIKLFSVLIDTLSGRLFFTVKFNFI
jgi:hypothetical protein